MNALIHLLLVLSGVAVALGALWYFARIRGGWISLPGLFTLALLAVALLLILAGFGAASFPGSAAPS